MKYIACMNLILIDFNLKNLGILFFFLNVSYRFLKNFNVKKNSKLCMYLFYLSVLKNSILMIEIHNIMSKEGVPGISKFSFTHNLM